MRYVCIVIVGMTPPEHAQEKSFEREMLYLTLSFVTFDELLQRLIEVEKALPASGIKPVCTFEPGSVCSRRFPVGSRDSKPDAGQCAVCSKLPPSDKEAEQFKSQSPAVFALVRL